MVSLARPNRLKSDQLEAAGGGLTTHRRLLSRYREVERREAIARERADQTRRRQGQSVSHSPQGSTSESGCTGEGAARVNQPAPTSEIGCTPPVKSAVTTSKAACKTAVRTVVACLADFRPRSSDQHRGAGQESNLLVGALARDRLTPLDLAVAREKPPVGAQGGGGADDDGRAGRAPITRAAGHP